MINSLVKGDVVAIVLITAACAVGIAATIWLRTTRERKEPDPKLFEKWRGEVRKAHSLSQK